METEKLKVLALHETIKQTFTEEQIRIMLVAVLEKQYNQSHSQVVKTLERFYSMFNEK